MNIYVVTHKKFRISNELKKKGYKLISVGSANSLHLNGIKDNTNDNISDKNASYCELTALYWIWKNDKADTIKGLVHYRRYFTTAIVSQKEKFFLTDIQIRKFIKQGYDLIVPYKSKFIRNADENYLKCGKRKDLEILRDVIAKKCPEYLNYFDYVFSHNWSYLTNMMIANSETFNAYCTWLFDILFETEKRVDTTGYTQQELRIFGYMSERLLTVWILRNNRKVKEIRVVNTENKFDVCYVIREIFIRFKIYQGLKTMMWLFKGKSRNKVACGD